MLPIAVIGAGPKAAALAAKSQILRKLGYSAPKVLIFEQNEIAANWTGRHGFTTGTQRLGTPPEKDVGFPYELDRLDSNVTHELFRTYSWTAYEIQRSSYSEWIDRGRPHPTHREWGTYLKWVIENTDATVTYSPVTSIGLKQSELVIYCKARNPVTVSGVVFTGPGHAKPIDIKVPKDPGILNGDIFWEKRDLIAKLRRDEDFPVVVVGGGETSGSIVNYLSKNIPKEIPILVLTRGGAIFSRGEGFYENNMFTDMEKWRDLPRDVRMDVIKRGDRGVFSVDVVRELAHAQNVAHRFMRITEIKRIGNFHYTVNGTDCQLIVLALGFNPYWFVKLFEEDKRDLFPSLDKLSIKHDLSISFMDSTMPKIYAPMLAGLDQGPGLPNLSCLGTLSDRILGRIPVPEEKSPQARRPNLSLSM
jgi:mycobactin lysine-N-oxygenase